MKLTHATPHLQQHVQGKQTTSSTPQISGALQSANTSSSTNNSALDVNISDEAQMLHEQMSRQRQAMTWVTRNFDLPGVAQIVSVNGAALPAMERPEWLDDETINQTKAEIINQYNNKRDISSLLTNVGTDDDPLFVLTNGQQTFISRTLVSDRRQMQKLGDNTDLSGFSQQTLDRLHDMLRLASALTPTSTGISPLLAGSRDKASSQAAIRETVSQLHAAVAEGQFSSADRAQQAFASLLEQQFASITRNQHIRQQGGATTAQIAQSREQAHLFTEQFFASLVNHDFDTAFNIAWASINQNT